jgi:hypothetical protein
MPSIYLYLDGRQKGPFTPEQVFQLLDSGGATGATPAWHEGLTEWSTVSAVLAASPAGPPPPPPPQKSKGLGGCAIAAIVCGALCVLMLPCCAGIALGPINAGIKLATQNVAMQRARQIELCMFSYATDHNGAYPDGKTSTEVFQKLLDGKYVTDPAIFYLAMPGKTKPTSNQLTAENVSFDVTSGVAADSSDFVPVVFCTGYTVTYAPDAKATRDQPVATPFPGPGHKFTGIAVAYKSGFARFLLADDDGSIPYLIPPTFDAGGKTYTQLRP